MQVVFSDFCQLHHFPPQSLLNYTNVWSAIFLLIYEKIIASPPVPSVHLLIIPDTVHNCNHKNIDYIQTHCDKKKIL